VLRHRCRHPPTKTSLGVVSATGVALTVFAGPAENRCDQHGGATMEETSVSAATMFGSPIAGS
jgi:hypothetical protein